MTVYGYARVSSSEQTLAGQDADLRKAGAAKVYREKISGVASRRPQFGRLMHMIGPGRCYRDRCHHRGHHPLPVNS